MKGVYTWKTKYWKFTLFLIIIKIRGESNLELPVMVSPPKRSAHWAPPPFNWYKANVDGTVFYDIQKIGIGVVFQERGK